MAASASIQLVPLARLMRGFCLSVLVIPSLSAGWARSQRDGSCRQCHHPSCLQEPSPRRQLTGAASEVRWDVNWVIHLPPDADTWHSVCHARGLPACNFESTGSRVAKGWYAAGHMSLAQAERHASMHCQDWIAEVDHLNDLGPDHVFLIASLSTLREACRRTSHSWPPPRPPGPPSWPTPGPRCPRLPTPDSELASVRY